MGGDTLSKQPEHRFVMDAGTSQCYPEEAFQAAFNEAFLSHLASAMRDARTARRVARVMRNLKTEANHQIILGTALRLLGERGGHDVKDVNRIGGSVVAVFSV
jgi:hypothetical protein